MTITAAFPFGEGIQINRQIEPNLITTDIVFPGDPGWLEAVAAIGGLGVLPPAPQPPSLDQARASAAAAINAVRGEVRSRFLTQLPSQDMVYLEKEAEARGWIAARAAAATDGDPDPSDFPHIQAEVGTTAADMDGVAQVYLNLAAIFRGISAVIEGEVMRALAAIEAAQAPEAAAAVAADFPPTLAAALSAAGVST